MSPTGTNELELRIPSDSVSAELTPSELNKLLGTPLNYLDRFYALLSNNHNQKTSPTIKQSSRIVYCFGEYQR